MATEGCINIIREQSWRRLVEDYSAFSAAIAVYQAARAGFDSVLAGLSPDHEMYDLISSSRESIQEEGEILIGFGEGIRGYSDALEDSLEEAEHG
jgi:hypothetical protein